jgi:hypothetical protein
LPENSFLRVLWKSELWVGNWVRSSISVWIRLSRIRVCLHSGVAAAKLIDHTISHIGRVNTKVRGDNWLSTHFTTQHSF